MCRQDVSAIDELEEMRQLIEAMRLRLHDQVKGKCFCDPEVLRASQELNKVLNEYERLLVAKCKTEEIKDRNLG